LNEVGWDKLSNAAVSLKNKDGELAIGCGNVEVMGNCDSSGVDHHLWETLETGVLAQTYSVRNSGGDPAI